MNKYRFRLETLHKLRIAQRDERRAALADGYRAEQILAERRAQVADEMATLKETHRAALSAPYADINLLVEAQRFEAVLVAQKQQLKEQSARVAIEVESRRLAVVEADRAVQVLEKLDERRRAEYRIQQNRHESKLLDEVASVRRTNL